MSARPVSGRGDAAFVLIAVLWMLALLAGLATIYSAYARASAASSGLPIERLRSEAAIRSGVELAAFQLLSAQSDKRPSHGAFEFPLGAIRVAVAFLPEAARIDLNTAPNELLAALFQALGLKTEAAAAAAAARVVAWRQPAPENQSAGAEDQRYREAGLPYGPRHGPFQDSLELALIPGLSPELVERALPQLTVFSGAAVDPQLADEVVRAALAASGPAAAAASGQAAPAASRQAAPGNLGQAAPGAPPLDAQPPSGQAATAPLAGATPTVYRASIVVTTPGRRTIHGFVVFSLQEQGDEPYQILLWRDDFDAPLDGA